MSKHSSGAIPAGRSSVQAADLAFLVVLGVVLLAYASVFWEQLHSGFEFDEAYNLSVSMNLAEGHGYAAQGAFHGHLRVPFDTFISTGPTLLVPAAGMWALGDGFTPLVRVVPLAFFTLYLSGLWVAGRRIGGRWSCLAALVAPLVLPVGMIDLGTHSLVPGRVVGEFTACGLLLWSALLLPAARTRTVALGGLCAGLAFETKSSFVYAIALVGLTWLLAEVLKRRITFGRALAAAVGVAVPIAAYETFRWFSLGHEGYIQNTVALRAFADAQHQEPSLANVLPRIRAVYDGTFTPVSVALVVLALLLALVVVGSLVRRAREWRAPTVAAITLGALAASGILLGVTWLVVYAQPSTRLGMPTLLLCLPLLFAVAARGLSTLLASAPTRVREAAPAGVVVALALWLAAASLIGTWGGSWHTRLLDEQQAAARVITESGSPSIMSNGWFMHVEYQLLTGLPPDTAAGSAPPTVHITSVIEGGYAPGASPGVAPNPCPGTELYVSWAVTLCPIG